MVANNPDALEAAHSAMRNQQPELAARLYDAAIREQPQSVEARVGRARCAMLQAQPAIAIAHLREAVQLAPDNAPVARSLGVALYSVGSLPDAIVQLERALTLQPRDPLARLHLGQVHERGGRLLAAAQCYYRALLLAQGAGHWLNRATTPAHLQSAVLHAMDVVDRERRHTLEAILQPFAERHGAAALTRVANCLAGHLKTLSVQAEGAEQRPRFLYFPDLPAPRFFERALFPWIDRLEAAYPDIRAEAQQVLGLSGALQPFLKFDSPEQMGGYLAGAEGPPAWDAYFFYRDGMRMDENHARCPRTSAILESLPLVRIREHAPEICFSILAPGTHILPHTGVSNLRVVVHLPLVVPPDCAIEVGGQTHHWRESEVVVFDDTFEHHAWNRSSERRTILLMDTWNPYLTDVERAALTELVAGIGDFNRG